MKKISIYKKKKTLFRVKMIEFSEKSTNFLYHNQIIYEKMNLLE